MSVLWFVCATSPQAQVFETWSPASCAVLKGCQTIQKWSLGGGSGSLGVGLPLLPLFTWLPGCGCNVISQPELLALHLPCLLSLRLCHGPTMVDCVPWEF